jgi:hypothetical protein
MNQTFTENFYVFGFIHITENMKNISPEMKLCGLIPNSSNSYIHVSGSDLYMSTISLHILL